VYARPRPLAPPDITAIFSCKCINLVYVFRPAHLAGRNKLPATPELDMHESKHFLPGQFVHSEIAFYIVMGQRERERERDMF
jgi:hypothetical protein